MLAGFEQTLLEEGMELDQRLLRQSGSSFALVDGTVRDFGTNDQQTPQVRFQLAASRLRHRFRVGRKQLAPWERNCSNLRSETRETVDVSCTHLGLGGA